MNKDLEKFIERAKQLLEDTKLDDPLKSGIEGFASSFNRLSQDELREGAGDEYDAATWGFIVDVVGKGRESVVKFYMDYYESLKLGNR